MLKAKELGMRTSDRCLDEIIDNPDCCDLVFDATSARSHREHWPILERLGKIVIDMTPSRVGQMVVPAVDVRSCVQYRNVNMVSCGGQASLPLAYILGQVHDGIEYLEVVSSIASRSAGPGTRVNIDEYVETTESALRTYSGANAAKVILILNPAEPCIHMQTTVSAKLSSPRLEQLRPLLDGMLQKVRSYVPGYEIVVPPVWEHNRIVMSVRVTGRGDYLPEYAGNLDIINCAAIAAAEEYAENIGKVRSARGEEE